MARTDEAGEPGRHLREISRGPAGEGERPVVIVERDEARRSDPLATILRLLAVLALLLVVGLLATMLFFMVSLLGTGERVSGAIGDLGQIAGSAADRARDQAQEVRDQFDPAHPPRNPLTLDPEFAALQRIPIGGLVETGAEYTLTLAGIERRSDAENPAQAHYAVIHRRFTIPREQRVLGVVVRTDTGEADYYLYRGESFRVGRAYYKVNWVSAEQQELAVVRYRSADGLTAPLKFEID